MRLSIKLYGESVICDETSRHNPRGRPASTNVSVPEDDNTFGKPGDTNRKDSEKGGQMNRNSCESTTEDNEIKMKGNDKPKKGNG